MRFAAKLARRHRFLTVTMFALVLGLMVNVSGAFADAGNPILGTIKATSHDNGSTVTIFVRGQWNWISHNGDCNTDRAATGAGIIWSDLNGPGTSRGNNEIQHVTITGNPTGGTFKLKFGGQTTGTIPWNATAAQVDAALEALSSIGAGDVNVTGGPGPSNPWHVEFTNALGTKNVGAISLGNKSFTGGSNPNVTFSTNPQGAAPVYNGYLVANGDLAFYVGTKDTTAQNVQDRMVHPVDRGDQVEGYSVAGVDYPAPQAFVDPPTNNPNDYLTWKGGCGRTPITATASKVAPGGGPLGEGTGRACATNPGSTICMGHPWGSWGYEKQTVISGTTYYGYSHTYRKFLDDGSSGLPDRVCVNFYDVHGGGSVGTTSFQKVNNAGEITVDDNGDNSIDTNAFNVGDTSQGGNCITLQTPTITTNASDSTVGNPIHDIAHLSGVPAGAGGTITFNAYGPRALNSTQADCSGAAAFTSAAIPVNGPGDYPSGDFNPPGAGKYDWIATYSGDPANLILGATTACGDANETSTVGKATPGVTTDAGGPYIIGETGTDLVDSATLSGAFIPVNGTITFTLYDDLGCQHAIGSSTVPITTNGTVYSDPVHITTTGTYHWIANFSGDSNNEPTANGCGLSMENPVVNPRPTSIVTNAGGPYTFDPVNGNDLADVATLSGGTAGAGGDLTFRLYSDAGCTQQVGATKTPTDGNPISHGANGQNYTSNPVHVTSAGTYHWTVHYTGDANNVASDSACGAMNENPRVLNPHINIEKTPNNQTIETGTAATFHIVVTNDGEVDLTNVTVNDPNSPNCNANIGNLAVGASASYNCNSPNLTDDLHNVAHTSGTSQGVTVTAMDDADVDVIHPQIDVTKNPPSQSIPSGGTAHFTIAVTNTGDVRLDNVVVNDPLSPDCSRTAAQTLPLIQAVGNHDGFLDVGETFSYACEKTNVTQGFVNVVEACGDDVLDTTVCDTDTNGGGPPGCPEDVRCGEVTVSNLTTEQNFVPNDRATLTGLVNTPNGHLTFNLYTGATCNSMSRILGPIDVNVNANGTYTTANGTDLKTLIGGLNTMGTYSWQVTYSGDTHGNADIVGGCGDENFTVDN